MVTVDNAVQHGSILQGNRGRNIKKVIFWLLSLISDGNFASTTFEYLRDAQFNTLKPEFVAFELLERGVFSCLATMLLQMAFGDRYTRLDPREKTRVITTMDLSPKEIENQKAS